MTFTAQAAPVSNGLVVLTEPDLERVQGGVAAIPAGTIAGGVLGGLNYLGGGGNSWTGFGTAVLYGAMGGAIMASGAGLGAQLFGGSFGSAGGWLAKNFDTRRFTSGK